ncbi:Transcription factor IIIA [Pseudolycoriella hygida]|uniref:Transcription factor IIIA n=1 Tax=Pseudolycoriella hygida TaxID=35572 RepID=A0A9Q0RU97_9DIPT|nr:Transcription factor IIIA [Pseudolycoriella hygida]
MRQTLLHDSSDPEFLPSDTDPTPSKSSGLTPITSSRPSQRNVIHCSHPECNLSFVRRDALDRHEYAHNGVKKHVCDICNAKYITQSHLRRHARSAHQIRTEDKVKCEHESCGLEFTNTTSMKRHYKQRHLKEKLYCCNECDEKFYRKNQLRRHAMQHTGVYPHYCPKCGKGSINLKQHEHHMVGHKTYKCTTCGETLSKWSQLMAHRKEKHSKKYECNVCKQAFSHKSNMESHMKIHSENKAVFQCDVSGCDKFYFHAKNLRAHVRAKHDPNRTWECHMCHRNLSTKQKLIFHIKLHSVSGAFKKPKKIRTKGKSVEKPTHLRNKRGIDSTKFKSTAAILTGVVAERSAEKMIVEGNGKLVEVISHIEVQVTDEE